MFCAAAPAVVIVIVAEGGAERAQKVDKSSFGDKDLGSHLKNLLKINSNL